MPLLDNLAVGGVVSFTTYPTTVHGVDLKDLKFEGEITGDLLRMFGLSPEEEHRKVASQLPQGVPDNPRDYPWMVFKTVNGTDVILGKPWINDGTVVISGDNKVWRLNIVGDASTPTKVKSALNSINIFSYDISEVS